jgi:phosphatidylserine decarboxylase
MSPHQYIERHSGKVVDEAFFGDHWVGQLYGGIREHAPALFRLVTQARMSAVLGWLQFDLPGTITGTRTVMKTAAGMGVCFDECVDALDSFTSMRKVFERKIRYQECRPMSDNPEDVVSPADARVIVGDLEESDLLFVKEKFFTLPEFLGPIADRWIPVFAGGQYAVFRLTPDKYHFNHVPVSGTVVDIVSVDGCFHSCNPGAVVQVASPFAKNRRVITIIDTDVEGGSHVGHVAMIEVVALMIGRIVQCYSREGYDDPQPIVPGMFLERGQPKSLYRPGSSTDVLLFEPDRIRFAGDLVANRNRPGIQSRYAIGLGETAVETDLNVRETIACRELK